MNFSRQVALVVLAAGTPLSAQRIKLPASLSALESKARADSNDAAAHYNVALAYWNEKRWDDAERALRLAVTIEPQFAQGYLALSRLPFARRGRLWEEIAEDRVPENWQRAVEESDRLFKRAFLIDPLVDLRIEGAVTPGRSVYWDLFAPGVYDVLFRGFDDIREAKYNQAYERFNTLAGLLGSRYGSDSLPISILWYRGLAAAHSERYDQAAEDFRRLLDRSLARERRDSMIHVPLATNEYRYVLAVVKHRAGHVEEAVPLYQEALTTDIGLYMAHVRLAEILETNRQFVAAVPSRRRAVSANPDDPSLLLDLGLTLGKAGQWAEAATTLQQAMEGNPRDARAPYYLGVVLQQLGKSPEARAAFERFLSIAPSRYERQIADARKRLEGL